MRDIKSVLLELKKIRKGQGICVKDVSSYINKELNIEISEKTIYGWESGNSKPDVCCFMALCSFYGIINPLMLFSENPDNVIVDEGSLGLQRVINLLSTIRDGEYVGATAGECTLSDNMKTELLYQMLDKSENEGRMRDATALKWAILQIEKGKCR